MRVEPLPAPVRRSLTQAVRAVLHGNLGKLDAAVRLSAPHQQQGHQSGGDGRGSTRRLLSNEPASSSFLSSLHRTGTANDGRANNGSGSGSGVGGIGATAVGLAASTTDREQAARERRVRAAAAAGQGGGEKSSEAGDPDSRSKSGGGGRLGGLEGTETEIKVSKARRSREHGAEARVEGLLRLEFARAMADMLYGFMECLLFLHPERPIFNGARFLQVCLYYIHLGCMFTFGHGLGCGVSIFCLYLCNTLSLGLCINQLKSIRIHPPVGEVDLPIHYRSTG